jgi:predicted Zn-dependent protease
MPIYLLGILGILGGETDAGIAAMMVGSASVQDGYLYYSRTQEASADQSAIALLCKSKQPVTGLENFLRILERSYLENSRDYQYKTTHPQTIDRYSWIKNSYKKYPNCQNALDLELQKRFQLIKAKLLAYTHPKDEVLAIYKNNSDEYANYALAANYFFNGDKNKSISIISSLIKNNPFNPFYHELLGEIYYTLGNYDLAIYEQKKTMQLLSKNNDLHLMMLGSYLLAESSKESIIDSISALNKSLAINKTNSYAWYLLAKAYALNDNLALAQYASAERYYLRKDKPLALNFAKKAIKNIDKDTVEWYRANDLIQLIIGIDEKDNKNKTNISE